ncbi:hypothetical protein YC2023_039627 [Brassica napus]
MISPRKNLQQRRDEQAIVLREIFMNFEQDLCDKLQHCIEPVLYALKRPHVLPQRDDVFFDDEVDETSDLLKEIHGAPIFDVYDDIDHIFDDCGDADITSNVFDEVSDIIIGTQEVSNNNFEPTQHVHVIGEFGLLGEMTCQDMRNPIPHRHVGTSRRKSMTWDFEIFSLAHQFVRLIQKFEQSRHKIVEIKCVLRIARGVKVSFDTLGFLSLLTSQTRERTQWICPLDIFLYLDHLHMGRMQYSDVHLLKLINETLGASILFNTLHVLENSTTVSEICELTLLFTLAFDSDFIRLLGHVKLIENCAPESFSDDITSEEQDTSGLVRHGFDSVHNLTTYNEKLLSLGHIETTATSVLCPSSVRLHISLLLYLLKWVMMKGDVVVRKPQWGKMKDIGDDTY